MACKKTIAKGESQSLEAPLFIESFGKGINRERENLDYFYSSFFPLAEVRRKLWPKIELNNEIWLKTLVKQSSNTLSQLTIQCSTLLRFENFNSPLFLLLIRLVFLRYSVSFSFQLL